MQMQPNPTIMYVAVNADVNQTNLMDADLNQTQPWWMCL